METDDLRKVLVLAEKRSYSAAADALFISPSTLSRHIAALEDRLGVALFRRNSRSVTATKHGEMLIAYAKKAIELENEYQNQLAREKQKESFSIRIGTAVDLSCYGIMARLAGFWHGNREIMLSVNQGNQDELWDMLRNGRINFAFVQELGPSLEDEFSRLNVAVDRLTAILPRDHLLAQVENIRLSQLQKETFLMQSGQSMTRWLMDEAFRKAGFVPERALLEVSEVPADELVGRGFGIALGLEQVLKERHCEKVAVVPLTPPERIWINLVWSPGSLTAPEKAFISCFRDSSSKKTSL